MHSATTKAHAIASETDAGPADFALAVSPTRLVIGQGDINSVQKVRVANLGQSAISVAVDQRNYTVSSDGAVAYQATAPYSASGWVTSTPTVFELAPGASQIVTVTVTLPAAPEPGDHQIALGFVVPAAETTGNIKINRGVALPVLITVPGPIDDSVALSGLSAPGFAIGGPVTLTATMTNTGTVHRDFRGDSPLQINAAGDTATFPDFTVLRGAVRDISTTWDPPLLCICHPSVEFTNADGSVQSAAVQVIVFPLKLLAIVVGALLIGLFALWFSRRRYRASVRKAALTMNSAAGGGDA